MNLTRSERAGVSWGRLLLLALASSIAPALIQAGPSRLEEKTSTEQAHYLFHANLDVNSLAEKN